MGKIKKDGIKNIYCSTCKTWMTEFYVSRHINSKSHFTKKIFETEHWHKQLLSVKRTKKKCGHRKAKQATTSSEYDRYQIQGDNVQNYTNFQDIHLTSETNQTSTGCLGDTMETENLTSQPLATEQVVSQDYFSANEQLCKTPENIGEFQIQGDTLQTCSHNHINILQEGCSDIQTGHASCSFDELEQVEQPLYEWNPSQNQDNDEIPQNLLEALGLDYDWETENEWVCQQTQNSPVAESAGNSLDPLPYQRQSQVQTPGEFPIEVVSRRGATVNGNKLYKQ